MFFNTCHYLSFLAELLKKKLRAIVELFNTLETDPENSLSRTSWWLYHGTASGTELSTTY